jgi:hypothetical protein
MTIGHVAEVHFDGKREMAKKRLQKLKAIGLISERRLHMSFPAVLGLASKGLSLLKKHGVLAEYPHFDLPTLMRRSQVGEQTIQHELEVMDVKAAFHSALRQKSDFRIEEFTTWPLLNQFEVERSGYGREVLVKPDGFIRIRQQISPTEAYEDCYFLEVDRSTISPDVLASRAASYTAYQASGGFAEWMGGSRSNPKEFSFRILMVFKTEERRNNIAERLLQLTPPILSRAWLSTFDEITADPLGKIWMRPKDYFNATRGTRFDPQHERKSWAYRRQLGRELLVEEKVEKTGIFTSNG